jgi:hypothetical protein
MHLLRYLQQQDPVLSPHLQHWHQHLPALQSSNLKTPCLRCLLLLLLLLWLLGDLLL